MTLALDGAWHLQKVFSLAGLGLARTGLSIFGWHFVSLNALASRSDSGQIPAASWRGKGARWGALIFAGGIALAIASMVLSGLLPDRYF